MTALSVIEHQAVATAAPREVLSFRLGAEVYGIDILAVQEIRRYEAPTQIANSARHLLGVMNLRGSIVPVIDLRRRLGLADAHDLNTVTIVVNVAERTVGLVVDAVSEVIALDRDRIQPRPCIGPLADAEFVVGLAQLEAGADRALLQLIDLGTLLRDL